MHFVIFALLYFNSKRRARSALTYLHRTQYILPNDDQGEIISLPKNSMERKQLKCQKNLSTKLKQQIIQSNFTILDSMLKASEEATMATVCKRNIIEELQPYQDRARSVTRVPIKKFIHQRSESTFSKLNTLHSIPQQRTFKFLQRKNSTSKKTVKVKHDQKMVALTDENHQQKGTQLLLQLFRSLLGIKDQTRKVIEFKEKEKDFEFKAIQDKIKKLINDGVISPDKPGSYTFSYDGRVIPVTPCDTAGPRKVIQVEGRLLEDKAVNLQAIIENKGVKLNQSKRNKQIPRMRYHSLGQTEFQTSKFLKNFDSLGSVWQITQEKENDPKFQTSKKSKELLSPPQKKPARRSKISIRNSQILKDEILDGQTLKNFQKGQVKNKQGNRISLKKRFKGRSVFGSYFQGLEVTDL